MCITCFINTEWPLGSHIMSILRGKTIAQHLCATSKPLLLMDLKNKSYQYNIENDHYMISFFNRRHKSCTDNQITFVFK